MKGVYEMSEKNINIDSDTLDLIQASIEAGVTRGVALASKNITEELKLKNKKIYDNRLNNTKLLLVNYNNFLDHCQNAIYEIENNIKEAIEQEENTVELFDELYNMQNDTFVINSILKSKQKTKVILKHINCCLSFYEYRAKKINDLEMQRRFEVIKRLYINEKKQRYEEIAEDLNISTQTVNRDRKKAIQELSILIFGIDGVGLQ